VRIGAASGKIINKSFDCATNKFAFAGKITIISGASYPDEGFYLFDMNLSQIEAYDST